MMLKICRGACTKRTRFAHGRYSVKANNGKNSKKRTDIMRACAARGPPPLLIDVDVEDEDPVDVTTGTMLVTDAVPD